MVNLDDGHEPSSEANAYAAILGFLSDFGDSN